MTLISTFAFAQKNQFSLCLTFRKWGHHPGSMTLSIKVEHGISGYWTPRYRANHGGLSILNFLKDFPVSIFIR